MKPLLLIGCLCLAGSTQAQSDPELTPKGVVQVHWTSGLTTRFRNQQEFYSASLTVHPLFTVSNSPLRAGVFTGLLYTAQQLHLLIGPTVSIKLFSWKAGSLGTAANLQLKGSYGWVTRQSSFVSFAVLGELGKRLSTGPWIFNTIHSKEWWFHWGLGWRLGRRRQPQEPFNQ
ncbi:MAG: hypothetical protein ACKO6K_01610 [Chitinophagaceae bacterium]